MVWPWRFKPLQVTLKLYTNIPPTEMVIFRTVNQETVSSLSDYCNDVVLFSNMRRRLHKTTITGTINAIF